VNQADSIGFEEALRAAGAVSTTPAEADLVVVNTCSVTASSDQGARQTIRRLARENPHARVVVTGCYATREPDEVAALPNVACVVPNDDKPRLLEFIRGVAPSMDVPWLSTADRFAAGDGSCGASIEPGVAGRTAFTLRVQTGCAEPCAYCIIPATRGKPRSVEIDALAAEIDRVCATGFKEIALTGVHLGSYGRDLTPTSSLIELLRTLDTRPLVVRQALSQRDDSGRDSDRLPEEARDHARTRPAPPGPDDHILTGTVRQPDVRFRVSSLEPMDCSRDVVDLVARSNRFAPHFHLPLQHASNRVLASMRRPYTIEYYSSLVDDIRTRIPEASIGTDIIVGFPGETEDDFARLASYLAGSPLTHAHVFPYSDRPGTAASAMGGKVNGAVIRERARVVRDIGQQLARTFRASQVGTIRRGLTLEDGSLVVTDNYLKVRIPPGLTRNEWVDVRIISAEETGVVGDLVTW
jgi:threonylcarbamoyladenosine tRNA methylthiotransferase MtaB